MKKHDRDRKKKHQEKSERKMSPEKRETETVAKMANAYTLSQNTDTQHTRNHFRASPVAG